MINVQCYVIIIINFNIFSGFGKNLAKISSKIFGGLNKNHSILFILSQEFSPLTSNSCENN